MSRYVLISLLVILSLGQTIFAQDDNRPTVAFLSFGTSPVAYSVAELAILDHLELDGFISRAESRAFESRTDFSGENIVIHSLDAGWELNRLNIMVETALDRGSDVLVAFTTPVAQAAIQATLSMDDPPAVIFASVYYPYEAGLADAPCIKPDHVTGSHLIAPYEQLINLLRIQRPDVKTIGAVFSSNQIAGTLGSQAIVAIAAEHGIKTIEGAVTQPVDFPAAVEGLVSRGAEALILTLDTVTSRGIPAVADIASENLIPVYSPSLGGVATGAMISAGYYRQVQQGANVGRMVSAYLRGELDTSTTAIDAIGGDGVGVGVNLGVADALNIAINPTILDAADFTIGVSDFNFSPRLEAAVAEMEGLTTSPDRVAMDRAYLESLQCTDEMIAEQQAALDAAEE